LSIYIVKRENEEGFVAIEQVFSARDKAEVYISCMEEVDTDAHELSIEEVSVDSWEPLKEYSYDVYCRFMPTGEKIVNVETNLEEQYVSPKVTKWGQHASFTGCVISLTAKYIEEAEEKARPLFEDYIKQLKGN
jgi:hypothetical protein